ncbi:MAG: DUF4166 domain-containing protein [Candidatus Thiodiazotropha sp. (ex Lucina pensylvanica)]|nr:DUF4166 domain-containing protein [Candidatus Thiodiazotropha sp. (ex Lucina pensylvanica)]
MSMEQRKAVIEKALGDKWNKLDSIIKLHYGLKPGRDAQLHLRGTMNEVYHSRIGKLFLIPGRIFGALVPYKGMAIPTEVRNWTSRGNKQAMYWHRRLFFPGKDPVIFRSKMECVGKNEIIEYVNYGMGIRLQTHAQNNALHFRSLGYVWKVGPFTLRIPNWAILGDAEIIEKAVSDRELFVDFNMVHPLFGKTFSYSGKFVIGKVIENERAKV